MTDSTPIARASCTRSSKVRNSSPQNPPLLQFYHRGKKEASLLKKASNDPPLTIQIEYRCLVCGVPTAPPRAKKYGSSQAKAAMSAILHAPEYEEQ
ncbi:hypothetical protein POX_g09004 [Penicillium oxalicum]|uniref:hypothetical protein n=1 Tax=Penicillium oxalicum TaxID=69781 RepID=UPI0020B78600|nr:hypothetical protein POX_g09004 [Penicillium oxalicum]KAI2786616.1 hypothetical protein POX_g09004 [Penicillium oxalicum]